MTTFVNVTESQFNQAVATFVAQLRNNNLTPIQIENGHKTLMLMYLGHDRDWSELQVQNAVSMIQMVHVQSPHILQRVS